MSSDDTQMFEPELDGIITFGPCAEDVVFDGLLFVRLHWVDLSGVLRTRLVSTDLFMRLFHLKGEHLLVQHCMSKPIFAFQKPAFAESERWSLHVDPRSLRQCRLVENHAIAFCTTSYQDLAVNVGNKLSNCPRSLLGRVAKKLAKASGAQVLLGFEIQFTLLDKHMNPVEFNQTGNCFKVAGLRGSTLQIMNEVTEVLLQYRVGIREFYCESDGQLKVILSPLPVVEAVDALMLAQETIRAIFLRHELKATMTVMPSQATLPQLSRNGCPMHTYLNGIDESKSNAFIAGILDKVPALCAFGMPHEESYCRIGYDGGAGEYVGWGSEPRGLPIRKISYDQWEFRFFDATANMYLAVAATLVSGLNGIQQKRKLAARDCSISLECLGFGELKDYGITQMMPKSLEDSLSTAITDTDMREWLGDKLFDDYTVVKMDEMKAISALSAEDRRLKYLQLF
ncbi:hypothetical protein F5Y04DRAFT_279966 [Hypomontagnella monticulosa]|nr:hypothetical protein F5Y04DRAFT_279966 [Hypomontagnella monticulosa]